MPGAGAAAARPACPPEQRQLRPRHTDPGDRGQMAPAPLPAAPGNQPGEDQEDAQGHSEGSLCSGGGTAGPTTPPLLLLQPHAAPGKITGNL